MLSYAALFLIIALIAALFGFGGMPPAPRGSLRSYFGSS
jgi:uncharacterized membrane protein YtjA (UPF0391 family)